VLTTMTFAGWVALIAGWYVTEIGRQPWLVSGLLLTADAISDVPARMIGTTFVMYMLLYIGLLISYVSVVFYLARKAGEPDSPVEDPKVPQGAPLEGTPSQGVQS